MAFDPDAYISGSGGSPSSNGGFDPDAYLASGESLIKGNPKSAAPVDMGKRFVRGAVTGAGQVAASGARLSEAWGSILPKWAKAEETKDEHPLDSLRRGLSFVAGGIKPDQARDGEVKSALAEGLGSSIPAMAASAANPVLGVATLAGQMGEAERDVALAEGDSEELAAEKAKIGRLGGAVMAALPLGFARKGAGVIERLATTGASAGAVNIAQDAAMQEAIDGKIDPDRLKLAGATGLGMGVVLGIPGAIAAKSTVKSRMAQLGKISTKQNATEANAAANAIATAGAAKPDFSLAPTEPVVGNTDLSPEGLAISLRRLKEVNSAQSVIGKSAEESAMAFQREGAVPQGKSAAESAKIFEDLGVKATDDLLAEVAAAQKAADEVYNYAGAKFDPEKATLGELIGRRVKYSGYEGTLIRDNEGNFIVLRDVADRGTNLVEVADTGKDAGTSASSVGIEQVPAEVKPLNGGYNAEVNKWEGLPDEAPAKAPDANAATEEASTVAIDDEAAIEAAAVAQNKGRAAFINPEVMVNMSAPAVGAAVGYQFGSTPEEKRKYAVYGAILAAGGAMSSQLGKRLMSTNKDFVAAIQSSLDGARAKNTKEGLSAALNGGRSATEALDAKLRSSAESGIRSTSNKELGGDAEIETRLEQPDSPVANPLPDNGWKPWISKTKLGAMVKRWVGVSETNIGTISPVMQGAMRQRTFSMNKTKMALHEKSAPLGRVTRELLGPDQFNAFDEALWDLDIARAREIASESANPDAINSALDSYLETGRDLAKLIKSSNRDLNELDNYVPRKLAVPYEEFRQKLGLDERSALDRALSDARKNKGRDLSEEERDAVANALLSLSIKGKPGYLKQRTVSDLKAHRLELYETFDVAMDSRINSVVRDSYNRAYFGNGDPSSMDGFLDGASTFGRLLRKEVEAGRISPAGEKVIVQNMKDLFAGERRFDDISSGLANSIRKAQTYAYLADFANAIPQFGDFFNTARRYGLAEAERGYGVAIANKARSISGKEAKGATIKDLGLHEGNPDIDPALRASNRKNFSSKVMRNVEQLWKKPLEMFLGTADTLNKEGYANAAIGYISKIANDPDSHEFARIAEKYSKKYPELWPKMLADLKAIDPANPKLNDRVEFFLFNELADNQPLSNDQLAQASNAGSPWRKILYGLRNYAIKQIDVLRSEGYEKLKNKSTRNEGLVNLATYALIVSAGQQFVGSFLRDKLLDRDADMSEYAISGLLQTVGMNRYMLYRAKEQGLGTAGLEFMVPGIGVMNDATKDLGLVRDMAVGRRDSKGARLVRDGEDLWEQSEMTKYIPGIGRELYAYTGRGREKERQRTLDKLTGRKPTTTLEMLEQLIVPPDKKSPKRY